MSSQARSSIQISWVLPFSSRRMTSWTSMEPRSWEPTMLKVPTLASILKLKLSHRFRILKMSSSQSRELKRSRTTRSSTTKTLTKRPSEQTRLSLSRSRWEIKKWIIIRMTLIQPMSPRPRGTICHSAHLMQISLEIVSSALVAMIRSSQ